MGQVFGFKNWPRFLKLITFYPSPSHPHRYTPRHTLTSTYTHTESNKHTHRLTHTHTHTHTHTDTGREEQSSEVVHGDYAMEACCEVTLGDIRSTTTHIFLTSTITTVWVVVMLSLCLHVRTHRDIMAVFLLFVGFWVFIVKIGWYFTNWRNFC